MTLILTCLTREAVVQVSDRRLVYSDGNLAEDASNKATVYCGHIAFAYTGLAQLGRPTPIDGKPHTDWWLMEALGAQPRPPREAFADVARNASAEVRRLGLMGDLRATAFVGAGWAKDRRTGDYRPAFVSISNFAGQTGVTRTTEDFQVTAARLAAHRQVWWTPTGQRLTEQERTQTNRMLKRVVKGRKGASALALVLTSALRRVANRNASVGKDVMISILPVDDVPFAVSGPLGGPPEPHRAQFVYLPAEPGFEFFMPNVVCNGMIFAGAQLWTGKGEPPGWVPPEWLDTDEHRT